MSLENYYFDGFAITSWRCAIALYMDEQGDWLAHFQELPNISAFCAIIDISAGKER